MGSKAKRQAVQQLIQTGDMDLVDGLESTEASDAVPDGPLDAAWLAEIKDRRTRLAANPDAELPEYRNFYKKPDLTKEQVDALLAAMEKAIGTPEAFYDEIDEAVAEEGVIDTVKIGVGCATRIPRFFPTRGPSQKQKGAIAKLRTDYKLPADIEINPNEHHYELCDPGWWHLLRAHTVKMKRWPEGLAPFILHGPGHTHVYQDTRSTTKVALIADFGVGQYHSKAIARQLEHMKYPHVFHLGDVYYGGTQSEFDANYANVLAQVMEHSLLFSMPENHELYSGGYAYQKFIADNLAAKKIVHDGSYFCMRYTKHQIVGIDVNWNKRQRFQHQPQRDWLEQVLKDGEALNLTTILLTGSAPFAYGDDKPTELYEDLKPWHDKGRIALWFWGDDHYCALFRKLEPTAKFVGSCIGHGGFPGDRMDDDAESFVPTHWVETEPRFPRQYELRDDLGNNGWVELTMLDNGGVELLYVDWLGCRRRRVRYDVDSSSGQRQLRLAEDHPFLQRVHSFP